MMLDFLKKLKVVGREVREVSTCSPLVAYFSTGGFFVKFGPAKMS